METPKANQSSANPENAVRLNSINLSGSYTEGTPSIQARINAREALESAKTPRLYETTEINLGEQGKATVSRTGTEQKGTIRVVLQKPSSKDGRMQTHMDERIDYGPYKILTKTADDAFKEVKKRIGYYVSTD